MNGEIKNQVENIVKEEFGTNNVQFKKEKNGENYKVYGLINNKYQYVYTVTENGYIVEHKDSKQCP